MHLHSNKYLMMKGGGCALSAPPPQNDAYAYSEHGLSTIIIL